MPTAKFSDNQASTRQKHIVLMLDMCFMLVLFNSLKVNADLNRVDEIRQRIRHIRPGGNGDMRFIWLKSTTTCTFLKRFH